MWNCPLILLNNNCFFSFDTVFRFATTDLCISYFDKVVINFKCEKCVRFEYVCVDSCRLISYLYQSDLEWSGNAFQDHIRQYWSYDVLVAALVNSKGTGAKEEKFVNMQSEISLVLDNKITASLKGWLCALTLRPPLFCFQPLCMYRACQKRTVFKNLTT